MKKEMGNVDFASLKKLESVDFDVLKKLEELNFADLERISTKGPKEMSRELLVSHSS